MKKQKKHNNDYDSEERFARKNRKSGWVKPGRNNNKIKLHKYLNMSTKDLNSDDYIEDDDEENYR